MTFTSRFTARLIGPIVKNLRDTLTARAADALEWANGSPLPDFANVFKSEVGTLATKWPVLFVVGQDTKAETSEDGSWVAQKHTIHAEVVLAGPDGDQLTEDLYVYIRAMVHIVYSMTSDDWLTGLDRTKFGGLQWDVTEMDFGDLMKVGSSLIRAGSFKVEVMTSEV